MDVTTVTDEDLAAAAIAAETAQDVWSSAAALSRTEYAALHFQVRVGLAPAEIAEAMHVRPGTVHTALTRARHTFEVAFTALQLARRGRRDCPTLDALLGARPLVTLDRRTMRAVKRHLDQCDRCRENSRRFLVPAELFGALAPVAPLAGSKLLPFLAPVG